MEHPSDSLHRETDALIVQMKGAVDHNAFAGTDAVEQYPESTELLAQGDRTQHEVLRAGFDKHMLAEALRRKS